MRKENRKSDENLILLGRDGGYLYSFLSASAIICSLIFSTIITVVSKGDNSIFSSAVVIAMNYVISPIAMLIAIGFLRYRRRSPFFIKELNKKFNLIPLISSILIFIGITFSLSQLNVYFVSFLESLGLAVPAPSLPEKTIGNVALIIICVCILPPIVEEYAFRGIIVNSLRSAGNLFAIIASGLVFSLFHMSPAQTIYQFFVGALYATIILYGGNLLYVIAMHFLNNLYVVLNYYFFNFTPDGVVLYVLTAVGLIFLVVGVLLLVKKGEKEIELSKEFKKVNQNEFMVGASLGILISISIWIATLVV